jgi:mTERF domain-containing protein, mitochondrial
MMGMLSYNDDEELPTANDRDFKEHAASSDSLGSIEFDDDEILVDFPVLSDDEIFEKPCGILTFDATNSSSTPLTLDQLSEAFAANVSYFYLKNELGLSDTAMWRITFEASSALGMTTAVIRHKVNVLRETMNLSDDDVRSIIERQPTILHLSADKNLSPTILYLLRALDLGRDDLRALVVACPAVLCYSITNLNTKIGFFTRLMGTVEECRELLLKEPNLLRAGVNSGLVPRLQFLIGDVELPLDKIKRIVQKNPAILLYSLEKNLVPKLVYYMIMKLQMSTAQVQKLLLGYPQILDYNLDRAILPTTLYFVNDLDFSLAEFRNILLKFPRIVTHSLRKIKHTVGYFRFELGMPASQVKKVLYRAPAVLGLVTDTTIRGKVEFLQTTLGLTDSQLQTVLTAMPSLLLLNSKNNLQPKIDFLKGTLQDDVTTTTLLRDTVLRLPTLLGYSFEKRIRPRVEAILKAGLDPTCITVGIPMKHEDFESWLQRRAEKYIKGRLPVESIVAVPTPSSPVDPQSSKRIVHWSRARRPHPTRSSAAE